MEESLTIEELFLLVNEKQEQEHRNRKFAAALQNIDLDEEDKASKFEEVQRRAQAALHGKSEDEYVFDMIGIEIEDDDE